MLYLDFQVESIMLKHYICEFHDLIMDSSLWTRPLILTATLIFENMFIVDLFWS